MWRSSFEGLDSCSPRATQSGFGECASPVAVVASLLQLHLRSLDIRFLQGVCNLDPSHAQFSVGFELLWKSNATADVTGGGAQAVMQAMGSTCKHRWCFPCSQLTSCCAAHSVPYRPWTGVVCGPGVGDSCIRWQLFITLVLTEKL